MAASWGRVVSYCFLGHCARGFASSLFQKKEKEKEKDLTEFKFLFFSACTDDLNNQLAVPRQTSGD